MPDPSDHHEPERRQRERIEAVLRASPLQEFERFRAFPVYTPRLNLARFLAHYELFKQVVHVPGAIVDLGVYRGASTFTWAKLCEILCPTDVRKVVYAFDTFAGFPALTSEDGAPRPDRGACVGGYDGGAGIEEELRLAAAAMDEDRHLRHRPRVEFIAGDVCQTVPAFVAEKGAGLRLALLNLDVDLYAPTRAALDHFVPRMSPGGVIVLDEYAVDTFGGESKAVDEYFQERFGRRPLVRKFAWHSNPSGYITVDW